MPAIPNLALPSSETTDAPIFDPTQAPYTAVVRITDTIGGVRYLGSGVLISPDEVLTANHVSYKGGAVTGLATDIDVGPGYNNGYGAAGDYVGTVTHYTAADNDPNISFADVQTDFSIIHLSMPVLGAPVMKVAPDFAGGTVHVTGFPLGDSGSGQAMVDSVQPVSIDPNYPGMFDGTALGAGSSGGPVWMTGADGAADVVGLVSAASGTDGFDMRLTAADAAEIAAWVKQDDAPPPPPPLPPQPHTPAVVIHDTTTGADLPDTLSQAYNGPVSYLQTQFIDITPDSLNIAAVKPNVFIHTGSGNDGVSLLGGQNVVDGGTGSNFLVGGTGTDTFFVDARGITSDTWSTVAGFHSGDAATLFGVSQGNQSLTWVDGAGAVGAKGLTLVGTAAGKPNIALTLAGFSTADLASGRITAAFGQDANGSPYLYVHAT